MAWFITADTGEFLAVAGEYLRAEPPRNTVVLTVTEDLRVRTATPSQAAPSQAAPSQAARSQGGQSQGGQSQGGQSQGGQSQGAATGAGLDQPLLGWWRPPAPPGEESAGPVGAVCMHTPTFPILLSQVSGQAAAELARDLATSGRQLPGVNAAEDAADAFAATWRDRTGDAIAVYRRMRLFRLAELIRPVPRPEGIGRLATERDRDLLAGWFDAFAREVGDPPRHDNRALVGERLGYGGITVWEADGVPVSLAGLTRAVAGMVRVGPVYTPPELRGRGYAGAATAAVSQAALEAGLRDVVLYTDLANPTSNALYQRLGYRPVEDRVIFSFAPARHGLRFTRERTRGLRPVGRR
jgi:RimJ/RimL family protein N-acetyltransferase